MEDLDTINRNMKFDDSPHHVSVFMGDRVMHVYLDSGNGKHGFEIFNGVGLKYQSDAVYSSLHQARSAGIVELRSLGGYTEPVIKLVKSDSERKLA